MFTSATWCSAEKKQNIQHLSDHAYVVNMTPEQQLEGQTVRRPLHGALIFDFCLGVSHTSLVEPLCWWTTEQLCCCCFFGDVENGLCWGCHRCSSYTQRLASFFQHITNKKKQQLFMRFSTDPFPLNFTKEISSLLHFCLLILIIILSLLPSSNAWYTLSNRL